MMLEYIGGLIEEVQDYFQGKRPKGGEMEVRACMIMAIEKACGIRAKGIEVGHISFRTYNREIRRRKKYWNRVKKGETTDTRRGYEKERAGFFRVGDKAEESSA